jgi:hypothetical protein
VEVDECRRLRARDCWKTVVLSVCESGGIFLFFGKVVAALGYFGDSLTSLAPRREGGGGGGGGGSLLKEISLRGPSSGKQVYGEAKRRGQRNATAKGREVNERSVFDTLLYSYGANDLDRPS